MHATRAALFSAALLFALAARADRPTWPQFRGPEANPVAVNAALPDRWSTTENVEWKAEVPGRGWSSPVVAGDLVFVTAAVTDGKSKPPQIGTDYSNEYVAELSKQGLSQEEVIARVTQRDIELPSEVELHYYLYAFQLGSGELAWRREIFSGRPPGGRHRKNSFMSETPVTDGERLYVYVANLGLYAFDLQGEPLWSAALDAQPIYLDFGTGASPVLHGDQILIQSDNEGESFLAAYDKRSGTLQWRTERPESPSGRTSGWATPYIWQTPDRTEIVTMGAGVAISYDLEGKELWRISGMGGNPAPMPFAYDGLLLLDAGQTKPIYAIRPGASGDITPADEDTPGDSIAWIAPRTGTYIPTPVAYDGGLYVLFDKGILARLNAESGDQTYKKRIDREDAAFTSSPWAYDGKVFCLSELGNTYVISAGDSFEVLHVNKLDELAMATPAIVGDRLLIRTESKLYSIRKPRG
ncbi:MAG: PQQ-like beta-propeller repeat protein [Bryobacterales bacterium]|nr:PQQ-like beta-propeller repeat protein [Bryobacterales bacterium]